MQIEGDCLRVIQALQDSDCCFTLFGHIIEETKRLCSFLCRCQFQHVRWNGNRLAHSLARQVTLAVDIDVWVEDLLRASTAGVANVPNAKYLAHLPH